MRSWLAHGDARPLWRENKPLHARRRCKRRHTPTVEHSHARTQDNTQRYTHTHTRKDAHHTHKHRKDHLACVRCCASHISQPESPDNGSLCGLRCRAFSFFPVGLKPRGLVRARFWSAFASACICVGVVCTAQASLNSVRKAEVSEEEGVEEWGEGGGEGRGRGGGGECVY